MKKIILLLLSVSLLFSSCASILNSRYQKVAINTKRGDEILINGEEARTKKGRYLLKRDLKPKQITIKSDGAKDQNLVVMQYKKSPLYILSWIPFGILLYPPFYDKGAKSYDYTKEVVIPQQNLSLANRREDSKRIEINKVSVNLDQSDIKYRYFPSYRNYLRKVDRKKAKPVESDEDVELENSVFSLVLNELLKGKGYIDTTRTVLKNSYLDNLLINATVKEYTVHNVANRTYTQFGGMVYVDLVIDWEVLDYYQKPIYSQTTTSQSGQFAILDYEKANNSIEDAIKDAMEVGLIEFMNSKKVNYLLHDRSEIVAEESFDAIYLPKSNSYVRDLPQSIKSSLTIKTKNGHGSGFIISSNGHIITNYHVVADTAGLKVVLNDKSEHDVEIIRVSKIHDLALLKIKAKQLTPFRINSSKEIRIATEIYAVGTPTAEDLSQTISKGIISGIRDIGNNARLIQTDASINSGNSGGAIVSRDGVVLGIVSSKVKGFGIEGVAFGIPAYEIFDKLNVQFK